VAILDSDAEVTELHDFNFQVKKRMRDTGATLELKPSNYYNKDETETLFPLKSTLSQRKYVRAATDGQNVDLTSSTDPNPIDGVTLDDGDDVLPKDQTDASENGIYHCTTATDPTTWSRRSDFDEDDEVFPGVRVMASEGTINGQHEFTLTTTGDITLGTTDLTFHSFDIFVGDTAPSNPTEGTLRVNTG